MKVLLINPHYPISEGPSPPLGLAFLGAVIEEAGASVQVMDLVVTPYSKARLESTLSTFNPDIVGATAVTMTIDNALACLSDVKSVNPEIVTIMGGPHVTFRAEDTLTEAPYVDAIVLGEGERTLIEFINAGLDRRRWESVRGLVYRDGDALKRTAARNEFLDVNTLPFPARHLLPLGRYRALGMPISMTTSRGCPFQCIFCVGRKMVGAKVRYRDPLQVVDELAYLGSLNFPQINIADDLFTANKAHCTAICDEIIRRGLKLKWSSFARVDTVSPEVLERMHAAGCDSVSFGIETANAEMLKTIRKGITTDQVVAAVGMCNDAGIQPSGSFILGLPGETPETIDETVAFGKRLREMGVIYGFHLLAPFPGTLVREKSDTYGLRILTNDWREYHANRAIVETAHVTKKMLDDIAIEWEQNIDLWLSDIGKRIASGEADEAEAFPLVNLERTVALYDVMMTNAVEQVGAWRVNGAVLPDDSVISELAERTAGLVKHTPEKLRDALGNAFRNHNLRLHREKSSVAWQWVDTV